MVHSAEYDLFMFLCVLCFHVFEDDDDDEDDEENVTEFSDGKEEEKHHEIDDEGHSHGPFRPRPESSRRDIL